MSFLRTRSKLFSPSEMCHAHSMENLQLLGTANKMAGKFSIDDAFESDEEDPIRLYGSTSDHVPLKGKTRYSQLTRDQSVERDLNKEVRKHLVFFLLVTQVDSSVYKQMVGGTAWTAASACL